MENDKLRALYICKLAGRVLSVINKLLTGKALHEKDLKNLGEGLKFLQLAKRGRTLYKNFQLSEDIAEASLTYGFVFGATRQLIQNGQVSHKDIEAIFELFINTLSAIASEQVSIQQEKQRIVILQGLFEIIRNTALERSLSDLEDVVVVEDFRSFREILKTAS